MRNSVIHRPHSVLSTVFPLSCILMLRKFNLIFISHSRLLAQHWAVQITVLAILDKYLTRPDESCNTLLLELQNALLMLCRITSMPSQRLLHHLMLEARTTSSDEMQHAQQFAVAQDTCALPKTMLHTSHIHGVMPPCASSARRLSGVAVGGNFGVGFGVV